MAQATSLERPAAAVVAAAVGKPGTGSITDTAHPGDRLLGVVHQATATAAGGSSNTPDMLNGSHHVVVETYRKGSGSHHGGSVFPMSPGAASSVGASQNMTGAYSIDIKETSAYEPLPTGSSASFARGGWETATDR